MFPSTLATIGLSIEPCLLKAYERQLSASIIHKKLNHIIKSIRLRSCCLHSLSHIDLLNLNTLAFTHGLSIHLQYSYSFKQSYDSTPLVFDNSENLLIANGFNHFELTGTFSTRPVLG